MQNKRILKTLFIMMMIVLFTFGFVGQGLTYAVDFNIDNTPINSEFDTEIAKTSTTTEKGWLKSAGDWLEAKWDRFTKWCKEIWDEINNILDELGAKIKELKDSLWKWALAVGSAATLAWAILKKQFPILKVVEWAASFLKGVLRGLADMVIGVIDLVVGAGELILYAILNPGEAWDKLVYWITHPGEVWDNIRNGVSGVWNEITESFVRMVINGDGNSRAEWLGYAASQVLGLKGLDKAGKVGNGVSKAGGLSSKFPLASKAWGKLSDSLTGLGDKFKSLGAKLFGNAKKILATTTAGAVTVAGLTFAFPKIEPFIMKLKDCIAVQQQDTGHYFASMQLAGKLDCPSGKAETGTKQFSKGGTEKVPKELLETKPKNSPVPEKWLNKGGSISIDENKVWTYTNKDGVSIRYPNGYPDFSEHVHPIIKSVEIDFANPAHRPTDFKESNLKAGLDVNSDPPLHEHNGLRRSPIGYTWHHHQDGKTMMLVEEDIHTEFKHRGGISIIEGENKK
ncbi:HNH endonuclease [Thermoactinomyces sp. DSM 45892]|uniref:HNH endonuclease n=1 Tax=Thermoactinomyces sp. DSM 45892 TaxID=1882753 RepID=UPI000896B562|nr:HNH endonuclease [Thermoactinomyces sp. DSM 45892]SDY22039.1 A nuclease of the HNH/ENDO VII superfamily with conserved WHH [Thermoactinomyces sp. DSM 45892]